MPIFSFSIHRHKMVSKTQSVVHSHRVECLSVTLFHLLLPHKNTKVKMMREKLKFRLRASRLSNHKNYANTKAYQSVCAHFFIVSLGGHTIHSAYNICCRLKGWPKNSMNFFTSIAILKAILSPCPFFYSFRGCRNSDMDKRK